MGSSPPDASVPGIFQAKNTGVGGHLPLQGIFLAQEWNWCLLNWQADSLPLYHLGSPNKDQVYLMVMKNVFSRSERIKGTESRVIFCSSLPEIMPTKLWISPISLSNVSFHRWSFKWGLWSGKNVRSALTCLGRRWAISAHSVHYGTEPSTS